MYYILYYKNDILGLYTDTNLLLHFFYNNLKIINDNGLNLKNLLKNYKIEMYNNILLEKIYLVDEKLYKFKENNNYLFSNNLSIIKLYNDINNNEDKIELNMFLNVKNENDVILQKKYEEIREQYINEKKNIEKMKMDLKKEHEKSEEIKRKFYVNKNLYFNFKNEMNNNPQFEIPELFKKEFIIFSNLEQELVLGTKNELYEYLNKNNNYIDNEERVIFNELFNCNNNNNISDDSISDDSNII